MKTKWTSIFTAITVLSCAILYSCGPSVVTITPPESVADVFSPVLTVVSPSDYFHTDIPQVWLKGTATVSNSVITGVKVVSGAATNNALTGGDTWSNLCTLTPGTNTFTMIAAASNGKSAVVSVHIVYFFHMPVVNIVFPSGGFSTNKPSIMIKGTAVVSNSAIESVVIICGGTTNAALLGLPNWSNTVTLLPGTNTIRTVAESTNGMTGDAQVEVIYRVVLTNKYVAYDGAANDSFGCGIAVSDDGDTVVAGAWRDNETASEAGSVYWMHWNGSVWLTNKFLADDGLLGDSFGTAVAVSADGYTFAVGADGDDGVAENSGAVYWFHYDSGKWLTNILKAVSPQIQDYLGREVVISADGNSILAAAYGTAGFKGAVYLFHYDGSQWTTNKFTAYDGASGDCFGQSVAISDEGNSFVVGAYGDDSYAGSIYRFVKIGNEWHSNKLTAYDRAASDYFGAAVGISADGNTVFAGAYGDDDNGNNSGSVYCFHWTGTEWLTNNKIKPADDAADDYFGGSLSVSADGNTFFAGAYGDDDKGSSSGSIYRFYWNGSTWTEKKFLAYDGGNANYFGQTLDSNPGATVFVAGAPQDDDKGIGSGSAYKFSIYE